MSIDLGFRITTTDGNPIIYDDGMGNAYEVDNGELAEIAFVSGWAVNLRIDDPERVLYFVDTVTSDYIYGTVDLSYFTNMTKFYLRNKKITGLTIGTAVLNDVDIQGNGLDNTDMEGVLEDLVTNGATNGTLNYYGNTVTDWAGLTTDGQLYYGQLLSRGWTITPSGEYSLIADPTFGSETTVYLCVQTSSEADALVSWGDGDAEWLTHNVTSEHVYAAGSYNINLFNPGDIVGVDLEGV